MEVKVALSKPQSKRRTSSVAQVSNLLYHDANGVIHTSPGQRRQRPGFIGPAPQTLGEGIWPPRWDGAREGFRRAGEQVRFGVGQFDGRGASDSHQSSTGLRAFCLQRRPKGPAQRLETKSVVTGFSAANSRRSANRLQRSQQALLELPQFVQGLGSRFGCQFQQFSRETHQGHLSIGVFVINEDILIIPVQLAA
jgi:hypothetical protein